MQICKTTTLVVAIAAAASLGAAFAPIVHGQAAARPRTAPRALDVLTGRGSSIGVSIRDVDDDDPKGVRIAGESGVAIEEVTVESPAEKAGIKKGDVIVQFDGERVRSARQFARLVQETPAGRNVQVSLLRDGQRTAVTLVPREGDAFRFFRDLDGPRVLQDFSDNFPGFPARPVPPVPPAAPAPPAPPTPPAFPDFQSYIWRSGTSLGITVGALSPQLAEYFGAKEGVLVTSVSESSAAAQAGLKAGDVITSWKDVAVDNPSELRRRIQRLDEGEEFTIGVVRDRKTLTLKGKIEPRRESRRTFRSVV